MGLIYPLHKNEYRNFKLTETTISVSIKGNKAERKKLQEMSQLALEYRHTWKYHKETPYVTTFILNRLKCHVFGLNFSCFFFYKIREQEGRKRPSRGGSGGQSPR
jgi:hypothetical protein